jgi:two-component system CheB/CheR fusion protein
VGIPVATAAAQHALIPKPSVAPFVVLFLAVTTASWLGGVRPGLLSVAVAAALGNCLFIAPFDSFKLSGPAALSTVLFTISAAAIAALSGSLRETMAAAQARAELLTRYGLLVDHTRDIVLFVRSSDGRILEANAAALRSYGYGRDELLSLNIQDLRTPDTRPLVGNQLAQAASSGLLFETTHRRRDGSTFPVEVSSAGAVVGGDPTLVSVIRDITERKQAEETLRRSEQRVRQTLDSILSPEGDIGALQLGDVIDAPALQALMDGFFQLSGVPMSIVDRDGRVLVGVGWQEVCTRFHRAHATSCKHCHESDTQLTAGIAQNEFRLYRCKNNMWDAATPIVVGGKHLGNIFTGQFFFDDEEPDYERFRAQARTRGFAEQPYLEALRKVPRLPRKTVQTAMEFFLQLAMMVSRLGYANVNLARGLREREVLTETLRQTDRHKNEFIAMLSHELRNPLAPVRNSIYILQRAPSGGAQAARAVAVIDRQVTQLTRLVDDLLDLTRISSGKIRLQASRFDLVELAPQVAEDVRPLFVQQGIQLRVEHSVRAAPVQGDAARVSQILGNLLSNAAKFTGAGGETLLSISADEVTGEAVVRVRDDGPGISEEVLSRLFQPFVQADSTIDRAKGGLGLGLALARSLAELHGGSLRASSEGAGKGAEFELRLPLVAAAAAPVVELPVATSRGRRILLIEDVVDSADSLREALELNHHTVEVARDGAQGLDAARAFRPEVVLCDIGLPGMDGYAVARALRADPKLRGVFLVALTGYSSPEDQRAATEAGFDLHLAKPPQLEAIEKVLSRAG